MFSRLMIISISRSSASGSEDDGPAVVLDAPNASPRGFRPLLSAWARDISAPSSASVPTIERSFSTGASCSALHRLVRLIWPLLTSDTPSRRLAAPVAHLKPGAGRQTSQGKTRDLRAIYLSHLRPHPPGDIGLRAFLLPRPDADASYALPVRQAGTLLTASFDPASRRCPCCSASGSHHQGPQRTCMGR